MGSLAYNTAAAQDVQITGWQVYCTQQENDTPASNMVDGNNSTFWHSPWSSSSTTFPIYITFKIEQPAHVDYINYTTRQDGNTNGNLREVVVMTGGAGVSGLQAADSEFATTQTANLNGASGQIHLGTDGIDSVQYVRIKVNSGSANFGSCAEMQFFKKDREKEMAFRPYFSDALCTQLKPEVTSAEDIVDSDVKALAAALLKDKAGYSKFRVGGYEAYRTVESVKDELRTNMHYTRYENPTGIYATTGTPMLIFMDGISDSYPVKLTVKNWYLNETQTTYTLTNGLNFITPTSTGNTFITYYTDDFANAPEVRAHFVNGQVQGYYDQETMDNADWADIMALHPDADDHSIIITQSKHAQLAYPASAYRSHCLANVDSLMTLYQQVQDAQRYVMALDMYGRNVKNRELFFCSNYGFMAATDNGAFCHYGSLGAIMTPSAANIDFWGIGHEWGHINQISPGFHWSGCGETTNNIYASWGQFLYGKAGYLRLEDEVTGINDYSGMRGGRFQTYFEEGLRKGVQWQLQDGPDYHGAEKSGTNNSRNYDHFVKLAPFHQLQMWGDAAGKHPHIIGKVIEGLRNTSASTLRAMDNGEQQVNWMKTACDSTGLDLLPFFEKAGMLKPINEYIEDYGAGWNKITQQMIDQLKAHVKQKGYAPVTEELNYVTGYNYPIYRDRKPLETPTTLGEGCTLNGSTVKVLHSKVKNAVAYETYDSRDSLIRITMYALGSDAAHSYTQVLYPGGEDAAYIMAVGFDGQRKKIYEHKVPQLAKGRYYTLRSTSKGGCLTTANCTSTAAGAVTWNLTRTTANAADPGQVWDAMEKDGRMYLYNPQTGHYISGNADQAMTSLVAEANAPYFVSSIVNEDAGTWTLAMNGGGQYLNSYSNTNTGFWGGGSSDANNIWAVEEITAIKVSIPSIGAKGVCYPFALGVPEGCKAYYVKSVAQAGGAEYAVMEDLGAVIPAGTPAIIVKGAAGMVQLELLYGDTTAGPEGNLLRGTFLAESGHPAGECLAMGGEAGGWPAFTAGADSTLAANTAYLPAGTTYGSTIAVMPAELTATAKAEAQGVISQRGVGYPTEGSSAYVSLSAVINDPSATPSSISQAVTDYKNATADIQLPQDGKAYTFTSVQAGGAKRYLDLQDTSTGLEIKEMPAEGDLPATAKFVCHKVGDKFMFATHTGKYLVFRGKDAGTNSNKGYVDAYDANQCCLAIQRMVTGGSTGSASSNADFFGLCMVKGKRANGADVFFVIGSNGAFDQADVQFYNTGFSSAFKIEEVPYYNKVETHPMAGRNWASVYLPFATSIPAGATAYCGSGCEGVFRLEEIAGGILPARTAAVVTSETPGPVVFTPSEEEGTPVYGNELLGTMDSGVSAGGGTYVLNAVGGKPGFYLYSGATLPVAKAYAELPAGQLSKGMPFSFGVATGIGIAESATDVKVYDMQGRRVAKTVPGRIYVDGNGSKFSVK